MKSPVHCYVLFVGRVMGNYEVKNFDDTNELTLRSRRRNGDSEPSEKPGRSDESSSESDSVNSNSRVKQVDNWTYPSHRFRGNLNNAVLVLRKNIRPGTVIGPPIGGELFDHCFNVASLSGELYIGERGIADLAKSRKGLIASFEQEEDTRGQTSEPKIESSKMTPEDCGLVGFLSGLPEMSWKGDNEQTPDQDDAMKRPSGRYFMSYDSVCDETSIIRGKGLRGNVTILTARIYGIPYGFVVSGKTATIGAPCTFDWERLEESSDTSPLSVIRSSKRLSSIPLPLREGIKESLVMSSPITFALTDTSKLGISLILKSLDADQHIHRTVFLLAKTLLLVSLIS